MLSHLVHSLLQTAGNINAYGLFSFLLFFGFFTGVLIWACALNKKHLSHMEKLPLDGGEKDSTDKLQS